MRIQDPDMLWPATIRYRVVSSRLYRYGTGFTRGGWFCQCWTRLGANQRVVLLNPWKILIQNLRCSPGISQNQWSVFGGTGSCISSESGSGSRVLMTKNWRRKKQLIKKINFLDQKIWFTYSWASLKNIQVTGEPSAILREHTAFQDMKI